MSYILLGVGVVLLFGGGEFLVRGAVAVARKMGISPLLVGMTIVAACTSAPELVVSVGAALRGSSDISIGNVVGSNIFNVMSVIGISAMIAPITVDPRGLRRDSAWMMVASVAIAGMALTGAIGRVEGALLLAAIVAYVWISYRREIRTTEEEDPSARVHRHEGEEIEGPDKLGVSLGYLAAGLVALVVGAELLVRGATHIAQSWGVPEAVIGLTLVAAGTSLPELATSMVAAFRGHSDVAVGNVVGSNIFNLLGILGVTSLVRPVTVAAQIASLDVWVMVASSLALAVVLVTRGRVNRLIGSGFLIVYISYLVVLF